MDRQQQRHPFELIAILLDAIEAVRPVLEKIKRHDKHNADQLQRAATRAPLLVAEGNKHRDGNRHAKLRLAAGEVDEARLAMQVAVRWGHVTYDEIARADAHYESAARILHRLTS
jgi:four helix bundle protein